MKRNERCINPYRTCQLTVTSPRNKRLSTAVRRIFVICSTNKNFDSEASLPKHDFHGASVFKTLSSRVSSCIEAFIETHYPMYWETLSFYKLRSYISRKLFSFFVPPSFIQGLSFLRISACIGDSDSLRFASVPENF